MTHALQWNCAANTVRVTTVEEMLAANRAAYIQPMTLGETL